MLRIAVASIAPSTLVAPDTGGANERSSKAGSAPRLLSEDASAPPEFTVLGEEGHVAPARRSRSCTRLTRYRPHPARRREPRARHPYAGNDAPTGRSARHRPAKAPSIAGSIALPAHPYQTGAPKHQTHDAIIPTRLEGTARNSRIEQNEEFKKHRPPQQHLFAALDLVAIGTVSIFVELDS
jgi:hypothetical protein